MAAGQMPGHSKFMVDDGADGSLRVNDEGGAAVPIGGGGAGEASGQGFEPRARELQPVPGVTLLEPGFDAR